MYDYSNKIEQFWYEKVRLSDSFKDKLYKHRKSNRDRLISRLPESIPNLTINDNSFKPQGSMAMQTIIQTRFDEEEYDIDDGIVLQKSELLNAYGSELLVGDIRTIVLDSLKDNRFKRQPELKTNCVRVFYAEDDEEKHHVDFPIYRSFSNSDGEVRELANDSSWVISDPTQVNSWFENEVIERNKKVDGHGSQMRKLVHLLKRFCRSRREWDMPNGMKLTMLVAETQSSFSYRIDVAFRNLLINMKDRLEKSKVINNLAHPDRPPITKTLNDYNVCELLNKINDGLIELHILDDSKCQPEDAKKAWDWIFQSDGFFDNDDDENNKALGVGLATSIPHNPVDHRGGGRFG